MQYEKTCPVCGKRSYSSTDRGEWRCPTKDLVTGNDYGCGTDITDEPAYEAEIEDVMVITDREVLE